MHECWWRQRRRWLRRHWNKGKFHINYWWENFHFYSWIFHSDWINIFIRITIIIILLWISLRIEFLREHSSIHHICTYYLLVFWVIYVQRIILNNNNNFYSLINIVLWNSMRETNEILRNFDDEKQPNCHSDA